MGSEEGFGAFFRSRRQAMGLSLREFCRRNGFNPGNLSRLERGLLAPPQSRELLQSYAKALKLDGDPAGRDAFFAMAAAENGRVPSEVLESRHAAGKLPQLFQRLQRGGRRMGWVRALNLESWAKTQVARSTLPGLIRRLVLATARDLRRIEFPAGEQVQRPGWDGIVEAGEADAHVPAGISVWELGTEKSPQGKAEEDYGKRSLDPLGLDPRQTTLVLVTPQKWQTKDSWRQSKAGLSPWKDVRVYDSATLEEWLERAPAVDAWLASMLGLRPEGVTTLDDHWANLQAITSPSLKPEVFLTTRQDPVKEEVFLTTRQDPVKVLDAWLYGPGPSPELASEAVRNWSSGPTKALAIETRTPSEAIDFVAAYAQDPSRSDMVGARTLIVEDRNAWRSLAELTDRELLLIAGPSLTVEPEMVAEAERRGHRVILASDSTPRGGEALSLPRVNRHKLEASLKSSGLEEARAQRIAREAGGSLTVLKRLLARLPSNARPEWSQQPEASKLIPFLMAGSWDADSEADRKVIERLSALPYHEAAEIASIWSQGHDPLLIHRGAHWRLISRDDSWFLLGRLVNREDLERFKQLCLEVLAEDDPAFHVTPEEHGLVVVYSKRRRHSTELREGLAESLAILSAKSSDYVPEMGRIPGLVDSTVRELLDGQGPIRWASLSPVLPLLAEASPGSFLDAAGKDLRQKTPALLELFRQEDSFPLGSSLHSGLIRALERIAWDRAYLLRASQVLASLDESVRDRRSGDFPLKSLLRIFTPWFPQTTVSVDGRCKVLRALSKRWPDMGWKLLMGLLPNQQHIALPTDRPSWQDWALNWAQGVSWADFWHQAEACATLLIEGLGNDQSQWVALIEQIENLPPSGCLEFMKRLDDLAGVNLGEEARQTLAEALREKTATHRRFPTAAWAMREEKLAELERLQRRFELADPVRKNAWLFGQLSKVGRSFNHREQEIEGHRREALEEIAEQCGWPGVLRLAETAAAPNEIGWSLAKAPELLASLGGVPRILPSLLSSTNPVHTKVAHGYVAQKCHTSGWDWIKQLQMDDWSIEQISGLLIALPFESRTWELADSQVKAVASNYWNQTETFFTGGGTDAEVNRAVRMLLAHGRPGNAVEVICMSHHYDKVVEPGLIMDVLDRWIGSPDDIRCTARYDEVSADLPLVFEKLQQRAREMDAEVDIPRLARLEWWFLDLLNDHPAFPATLFGQLRKDPEFFVEILGMVFRPKHRSRENEPEPAKEDQIRAMEGFQLLQAWREVPGLLEDGTIDEKVLGEWVRRTRELARERDLIEVCEERIGAVLAHAPSESDGSWPCIPVRDVIEDIDSQDLITGLYVGRRGGHGFVWKPLNEVGEQERGLAAKHRRDAEACDFEWPRTATALRWLADAYEDEARRADLMAATDD